MHDQEIHRTPARTAASSDPLLQPGHAPDRRRGRVGIADAGRAQLQLALERHDPILETLGGGSGSQIAPAPDAGHVGLVEGEEVGGAVGLAGVDVLVEAAGVVGVEAPEHGDEVVGGGEAGGLGVPVVGPGDAGGFGEGGGEGGGVVDEAAFAAGVERAGAGAGGAGRRGGWGGGRGSVGWGCVDGDTLVHGCGCRGDARGWGVGWWGVGGWCCGG